MNKLGVSQDRIEDIENILFETKSRILSEEITFNLNEYDIEYLKSMHKFLFGDLYNDAGEISNRFNKDDIDEINNKIKDIVYMINSNTDVEYVKNYIDDIMDLQPFEDGNKRTIRLFFEIISRDKEEYKSIFNSQKTI